MTSVDIAGERYGRLVALERLPPRHRRGYTLWRVRCDCGVEKAVQLCNLRNGHTKSCGCAKPGIISAARRRHGHASPTKGLTATYNTWRAMRDRCHLPKSTQYRWYGARGIVVCERWRNSYEAFLADMGERPEGRTIDRINPDGNYEPANCRWATRLEQSRNQRRYAAATRPETGRKIGGAK